MRASKAKSGIGAVFTQAGTSEVPTRSQRSPSPGRLCSVTGSTERGVAAPPAGMSSTVERA
ncbi:hypothetical protein Kpho02_43970 [Kitasatospora phosalacinea]|uniref:Uncharacterized protein n=1 Tax=Kitasatospora phosalacinea TaxID=2065 RepID=A0A9W6QBY3_9ACTN|nr:hypothetical protein [Kitasatospora phosalacinea]GLW72098.1 hypothetical protein Kpho02_43970 [Kitasatospora phosalacinea]